LVSGNLYQLTGPTSVGVDVGADGSATGGDPAVLTIEPGVTVYASDLTAALFVQRGSEIQAVGTATSPIIFTSAQDLGLAGEFGQTQRNIYDDDPTQDPNSTEWGGISLLGQATINTCSSGVCEGEGEGDAGDYGGSDDTDSSGTMR